SSGSVIQVENGVYRAAVSSDGGFRVDRLLPGGHVERAISSDEVILGSTAWKARTLRIEDTSSFYVRVSATATLGDHAVREIWEFTRSGTIHAQVEVRPGKHSSPATTLLWRQVCDDTGKVRAQGETDDVWVQRAIGPLGGLQQPWPGVRSRSTPVARSGNRWERAIALPPMTDGQRFLSNVLLLVDATQHGDGLPVQHYPWSAYDFYAEHGLLTETATGFTFIDWNNYKYLMDALVPVELSGHRFREDTLIRTGVHLRDRLALDDGWVRAPSWSGGQHTYPHGDRFTTSARSYPALVYLWAHLTMDQVGDRWVHVPGDGDCFYHQLQRTLPFLDPRSPSSFSDLRSATGTPYLAYSLALRERSGNGPRGVINSHAHALHFAAQMREASEMFGDATAERAWREVVLTHHRGSKELLPALHPATRDGRTYLGLVNYSENQPSTHPSVDYSSITFEALPAGYELAAEHDPIFALAVERWCRYRTDPFQPAFVAYSDAGLVQRLWRLMPTTFAFAPSVEEAPRWFAGSRWATWFTHPEIEVLVGDFGGDQRADVLKFDVAPDGSEGPGGVWVGTSTGASFTTRQWATWITNRHTKVLAGNFDGRGKTDIMKFDVR